MRLHELYPSRKIAFMVEINEEDIRDFLLLADLSTSCYVLIPRVVHPELFIQESTNQSSFRNNASMRCTHIDDEYFCFTTLVIG